MGREVEAGMSSDATANRGRPSDWGAMGASWMGIAKRKACCGDDDVDELGVSIGQRVTAELVFGRRKNKGETMTKMPASTSSTITMNGIHFFNHDDLIMSATAYYLGRATISVDAHCQCVVRAWPVLSRGVREYIQRIVEEAFRRDARKMIKGEKSYELGEGCDRESWEKVRACWKK